MRTLLERKAVGISVSALPTTIGIERRRITGRPYNFTTAAQLLSDFWREVKRILNEKEIPNDL